MFYFFLVLLSVLAYLLGSVPFGLIIAKLFCGVDPRTGGSGNVGATNVARLCGFKWGMLTLACDLLKGFLPVVIYAGASGPLSHLAYPIGLAVVLGHMYSCFLKFKGGKGVATTVGVFLGIAPLQLAAAGAACILVIWRTGFVSAGSLTMVCVLALLLLFTGTWPAFFLSLVIGGLVVYAHRENIGRLRRGEEKPWLKRKEKD